MRCIGGSPIMTSLIAGGVAGGGGLPAGEEGSNGGKVEDFERVEYYCG